MKKSSNYIILFLVLSAGMIALSLCFAGTAKVIITVCALITNICALILAIHAKKRV